MTDPAIACPGEDDNLIACDRGQCHQTPLATLDVPYPYGYANRYR